MDKQQNQINEFFSHSELLNKDNFSSFKEGLNNILSESDSKTFFDFIDCDSVYKKNNELMLFFECCLSSKNKFLRIDVLIIFYLLANFYHKNLEQNISIQFNNSTHIFNHSKLPLLVNALSENISLTLRIIRLIDKFEQSVEDENFKIPRIIVNDKSILLFPKRQGFLSLFLNPLSNQIFNFIRRMLKQADHEEQKRSRVIKIKRKKLINQLKTVHGKIADTDWDKFNDEYLKELDNIEKQIHFYKKQLKSLRFRWNKNARLLRLEAKLKIKQLRNNCADLEMQALKNAFLIDESNQDDNNRFSVVELVSAIDGLSDHMDAQSVDGPNNQSVSSDSSPLNSTGLPSLDVQTFDNENDESSCESGLEIDVTLQLDASPSNSMTGLNVDNSDTQLLNEMTMQQVQADSDSETKDSHNGENQSHKNEKESLASSSRSSVNEMTFLVDSTSVSNNLSGKSDSNDEKNQNRRSFTTAVSPSAETIRASQVLDRSRNANRGRVSRCSQSTPPLQSRVTQSVFGCAQHIHRSNSENQLTGNLSSFDQTGSADMTLFLSQ